MKKAFTLVEILISITLFMIILLFLYKALDQTKHSNYQFAQKEQKIKNKNNLYNIFLEDIAEAIIKANEDTKIKIIEDKKKNNIVQFKSNNIYHNPFFNHVTYLVTSNKKLVRIESKIAFDIKKPKKESFYKQAYIDILLDDIEYFSAKKSNLDNSYLFIIKQKDIDKYIFNTYALNQAL